MGYQLQVVDLRFHIYALLMILCYFFVPHLMIAELFVVSYVIMNLFRDNKLIWTSHVFFSALILHKKQERKL